MIKISFRFEDEFVDAIYINNSIIIIYLCPLHKKIVCAKPPKRGPYSFWFFRSHISSWCVILTFSNIKVPPWKWKKLGCQMGNVLWKLEDNKTSRRKKMFSCKIETGSLQINNCWKRDQTKPMFVTVLMAMFVKIYRDIQYEETTKKALYLLNRRV